MPVHRQYHSLTELCMWRNQSPTTSNPTWVYSTLQKRAAYLDLEERASAPADLLAHDGQRAHAVRAPRLPGGGVAAGREQHAPRRRLPGEERGLRGEFLQRRDPRRAHAPPRHLPTSTSSDALRACGRPMNRRSAPRGRQEWARAGHRNSQARLGGWRSLQACMWREMRRCVRARQERAELTHRRSSCPGAGPLPAIIKQNASGPHRKHRHVPGLKLGNPFLTVCRHDFPPICGSHHLISQAGWNRCKLHHVTLSICLAINKGLTTLVKRQQPA